MDKLGNRNVELAKNTLILGLGQFVPKLISLVVLPILTAYLSTEEYGNFDLVNSFSSLLLPIMTLQIQQAVFRHLLAAVDDTDKARYTTNSIIYVLGSSVIIIPITFFALMGLEVNIYERALICFLYLSETIYTLFGQIVRGLGYNIKFSLSVIIYATINMIGTVLFVALWRMGFLGVVASVGLGYFGAVIYMIISSGMIRYIKIKEISIKYIKELLSFSIPIVPSSISLWIVNLSDRLIIIRFLDVAANGIYAVANKIPTLYNTAYSIFNLAWTETASRVLDDGETEDYYSKMFNGLFRFLVGAMLLLIAVTPMVFKVLVQGDYGDALYQVPILYLAAFFNSFVNYYSGIYIALKRTKQVGISSGIGAVLNVIINVALINVIGLYAASISTAVSFMLIALYRAYDLNKVIKIKYEKKNIAVGFCLLLACGLIIYGGQIYHMLICLIIAIVYNLKMNGAYMGKVIGILKKKLRKKS